MPLDLAITRARKVAQVLKSARLLEALISYGVLAGSEHRRVLTPNLATVIDIGANRGQFALAARHWAPNARVISFEPLPSPAVIFRKVFQDDDVVTLYEAAIGHLAGQKTMHISARDDSSSLLPISDLQQENFPGTHEVATMDVRVAPLETLVPAESIAAPAMLKLDVQGFELEALRGCESLLARFMYVYCECSFAELYFGQALAEDIVDWLSERGFGIAGIFNTAYDRNGQPLQADFLFRVRKGRGRDAMKELQSSEATAQ
jgi:FkbM family methyltransferase